MCHDAHGDEYACLYVRRLVSGLPSQDRSRCFAVLQFWLDDSGKGQPPVFVLAGYVARVEQWNAFADEWQIFLNQNPRLEYIKGYEAAMKLLGFVDSSRAGTSMTGMSAC